MQQLKVYRAGVTFPDAFGDPLVVITADDDSTRWATGEWFVITGVSDFGYMRGTISVSKEKLGDLAPEGNADFVMGLACAEARLVLLEALQKADIPGFLTAFSLEEVERSHLLGLRLRQRYVDELGSIMEQTQNSELKNYLAAVEGTTAAQITKQGGAS